MWNRIKYYFSRFGITVKADGRELKRLGYLDVHSHWIHQQTAWEYYVLIKPGRFIVDGERLTYVGQTSSGWEKDYG